MDVGVKGSLLERLKQFRINWLRRKKKGKIVKHPKLKQLFYNTLALIYFPIGTVLDCPKESKVVLKSKAYQECLSLEKEVIQIQKRKMDLKPKVFIKKVETFEKRVISLQKKVAKEDSSAFPILNQKLSVIQRQIQVISSPSKLILVKPIIESTIQKEVKQEPQVMESPLTAINIQREEKLVQPLEEDIRDDIFKRKEKDIIFIKGITEKMKELEENLTKLHIKIRTCHNYNELYDFEFQLKEFEKKLEEYNKECKNYPYIAVIDITVDPLELHKNSKKIDDLLNQIQSEKKNIVNKKDILYYPIKEEKKEKKQEIRKEEKQEKKQEKQDKLEEYTLAQELILDNIRKQRKVLEDFDKKMKKTNNKRRTLFSYLSNISTQILNLTFSFTPFFLLKNKVLSTLVTSVFVNNSLKTMKKMIHPDTAVFYEMMEENYKEKQNAYQAIYRLSVNSLEQIERMRDDLLALEETPSVEVEQLLKQLDSIETAIIEQKSKIEVKRNIVTKDYQKKLGKGA